MERFAAWRRSWDIDFRLSMTVVGDGGEKERNESDWRRAGKVCDA